jgi:hypothetical protein
VKPEGKRLVGRSRRRWEMDLSEIDWKSVDWMHLVSIMISGGKHGNDASGPVKDREFLDKSTIRSIPTHHRQNPTEIS